MHAKSFNLARRAGFTLVELLAVILIMSVLLSIGAVGLRNVGKAQGTTAAAAIAEALMEEARTIAVSRGTTARLIVNADSGATDLGDQRYLREMYVVYREVDETTGDEITSQWVRASRPTMLPDKVFFDIEGSQKGVGNTADSGSGSIDAESHQLDGGNPSSMNAYYYEFNSEGICQSPGASFVVIEGVMVGGTMKGDDENKAGFVVWRNGRTSVIRDHGDL
ncbi:MAG: pilus assembly FimT family protein [Verrucomicrobiales bacterium]